MRVNTIKKIIAAILAAVLCFGVLPSRSFFNTLSAVVKAANADSLNEAYADRHFADAYRPGIHG